LGAEKDPRAYGERIEGLDGAASPSADQGQVRLAAHRLGFPDYHHGCQVHPDKTREQREKGKKLIVVRELFLETIEENTIQTQPVFGQELKSHSEHRSIKYMKIGFEL